MTSLKLKYIYIMTNQRYIRIVFNSRHIYNFMYLKSVICLLYWTFKNDVKNNGYNYI